MGGMGEPVGAYESLLPFDRPDRLTDWLPLMQALGLDASLTNQSGCCPANPLVRSVLPLNRSSPPSSSFTFAVRQLGLSSVLAQGCRVALSPSADSSGSPPPRLRPLPRIYRLDVGSLSTSPPPASEATVPAFAAGEATLQPVRPPAGRSSKSRTISESHA